MQDGQLLLLVLILIDDYVVSPRGVGRKQSADTVEAGKLTSAFETVKKRLRVIIKPPVS